MPEPHLEICKDCDNPMDNCRCEDWMAEDDASKPAASPVAGVSETGLLSAAIVDIAIAAGITKGELPMTGPEVLTLAKEIEHFVAQPSAEGDGWIAVTERLPKEFTHVLVAWGSGDIDISMRNGDGWGAPIIGKPAQKSYTHWRPLPAPPVAKEGRES